MSTLTPYVCFNGRTEEAIEFYRRALGARVAMLMRFADSPEPLPPGMVPPGSEQKVMHAELDIDGAPLMLSDGSCTPSAQIAGVTLSLALPDEAAARRAFEALADGGQVSMPLGPTFWSPLFGMLNDRFGLGWMVTVTAPVGAAAASGKAAAQDERALLEQGAHA